MFYSFQKMFIVKEDERKTVFIRNLSIGTTEDELKRVFGIFGTIVYVRIIYGKDGISKRIAYVEYQVFYFISVFPSDLI